MTAPIEHATDGPREISGGEWLREVRDVRALYPVLQNDIVGVPGGVDNSNLWIA